jgi:hypothetical protein
MPRPVPRRFVLLGLGAALAACGSSRSPTLYTLAAEPGAQFPRALPPADLRIVEVAQYLARPEIVRRNGAFELDAAEYERWGEPFDAMVTRVLLEDLALRLPGTALAIASSSVALRGEAAVGVAIARFDPDPDGTVQLEARWTIDRGAKLPAKVQLERIARPGGTTATDLVGAMSDCLATLADRIAEGLNSLSS